MHTCFEEGDAFRRVVRFSFFFIVVDFFGVVFVEPLVSSFGFSSSFSDSVEAEL